MITTWTLAAGGNFASDLSWSTRKAPAAGDTANITNVFAGDPYSVGVTDAEAAALVNIGAVNAELAIEGGVLTVGSIDLTAGTLAVVGGGEITGNTTISAGSDSVFVATDGTLDDVTWKGTLALAGITQASFLTITSSLDVLDAAGTGPGVIDITGPGAALNVDSSLTLDGTGGNLIINMGAASAQSEFLSVGSADVLTLGSLTSLNASVAGSAVELADVSVLGTIVNDGTMTFAAGAGSSAEIDPDTFINNGTIEEQGGMVNGESLDIATSDSFALGATGVIALSDFGRIGISATNVPGALDIEGIIEASGSSTVDLSVNATGAGSIILSDHGTADIFNFTGTVSFSDATDDLALEQPINYTGIVAGLSATGPGVHDNIDLLDTNVTGFAPYVGNALGGTLTVMNGIAVAATIQLVGNYVGATFAFSPDGQSGNDIFLMCFVAGTLIGMECGEVPVEQLAVGDRVRTAGGELRPIVWIGEGRVPVRRGRRNAATPVIVRRGALADNVPLRDLRITKGHALFIDDVLIPVEELINHRSILWDDRAQEVTVYHVELETHDVLLADGAPAESYRDDGNRWLFRNANADWYLPPKTSCAPLLSNGPVVDAIWRRLSERAGAREVAPLTDDADLHLLVDGKRLDALGRRHDEYVFRIPSRQHDVRICSRSAVPQELRIARDPRMLGVAVRRIVLAQARRQRAIEANEVSLTEGFHAYEPENRICWTNGDAVVPPGLFVGVSGPAMLMLHLGGTTRYLDEGTPALRVA